MEEVKKRRHNETASGKWENIQKRGKTRSRSQAKGGQSAAYLAFKRYQNVLWKGKL